EAVGLPPQLTVDDREELFPSLGVSPSPSPEESRNSLARSCLHADRSGTALWWHLTAARPTKSIEFVWNWIVRKVVARGALTAPGRHLTQLLSLVTEADFEPRGSSSGST